MKIWLVAALPLAFAAAGHTFPAPDRPVAAIISPQYSDEATRDRNGEAQRVIDRLGIKPGARVADIGAGTGYYTIRTGAPTRTRGRRSMPRTSSSNT